jgi:hypothetical protein
MFIIINEYEYGTGIWGTATYMEAVEKWKQVFREEIECYDEEFIEEIDGYLLTDNLASAYELWQEYLMDAEKYVESLLIYDITVGQHSSEEAMDLPTGTMVILD